MSQFLVEYIDRYFVLNFKANLIYSFTSLLWVLCFGWYLSSVYFI